VPDDASRSPCDHRRSCRRQMATPRPATRLPISCGLR
jgi:hypothetical protein